MWAAAPGCRSTVVALPGFRLSLGARRPWAEAVRVAALLSGRAGLPGKRSYEGAGARSGLGGQVKLASGWAALL